MKKRYLILWIIIVVAVAVAVSFGGSKLINRPSSKNPQDVVSKKDKDTGAVINYYPNQNKELASQNFVLLNGEELANFLGPGQYDTVTSQIQTIIQNKTNHLATTAKVIPGSVAWDVSGDFIRAKIKQDSPALQFTADIKLTGDGTASVTSE